MRLIHVYILPLFLGSICYGLAFADVAPGIAAAPIAVSSSRESALEKLKESNPKRYLRMLELKDADPKRYEALKAKVLQEHDRLEEIRKLVPANVGLQEEMWKNRTRLEEIMRSLRSAEEGPGKVILISQMGKLLGQQFDLRMQMKQNRLARAQQILDQRLESLKQEQGQKSAFVIRWRDKLAAQSESTDTVKARSAGPKR